MPQREGWMARKTAEVELELRDIPARLRQLEEKV
jgi:hypothetical protein